MYSLFLNRQIQLTQFSFVFSLSASAVLAKDGSVAMAKDGTAATASGAGCASPSTNLQALTIADLMASTG